MGFPYLEFLDLDSVDLSTVGLGSIDLSPVASACEISSIMADSSSVEGRKYLPQKLVKYTSCQTKLECVLLCLKTLDSPSPARNNYQHCPMFLSHPWNDQRELLQSLSIAGPYRDRTRGHRYDDLF